ncbi:Glucosaminyl phosphatidylinositol (GlcN-PI) nositol acylation protein [Geranomyces variabilis]|nr:Glucosaminyl phosphatidylinositol (GlcN-PI) nositol acylation protein [Geranomyces variabilis]
MDEAKRKAKEAHVSGHDGTTLLECQLLLVVTMVSYALWKCAASRFPSIVAPTKSAIIFDFIILCVPFLVAVATTRITETIGILLLLSAATAALPRPKPPKVSKAVNTVGSTSHWPFLVTVRATLQVVTACIILMVDFKVFPSRFAKTETYGTSLMDLGVGMFVFTGGIVAGPRIKTSSVDRRCAIANLGKSIRASLVVLTLGLLRMVVTKSVNYQEHVSEYGVHWNFFMTLGLIPVLISAAQVVAPRVNLAVLGGIIMLAYTLALRMTSLELFILYAPRTGIVSMNREGICSLFGYLTIYLVAAAIGVRLHSYAQSGLQKHLPTVIVRLSLLSMLLYGLTVALQDVFFIPVSRRMANVSYATWVLAGCSAQVAGSAAVDFLFGSEHVPILYKAVNRNQLAVFLLANVMTGLINMSMDTLEVPDVPATLIVGSYMLFLYIWQYVLR